MSNPTNAFVTCPRCGKEVPTIVGEGPARILRHDRPDGGGRCRASGSPVPPSDEPDPVALMVIHILTQRNVYGRHSDLALAISELTAFANQAWDFGYAAGVATQLVVLGDDAPGRAAARFFGGARCVDPDDLMPPTPEEEARRILAERGGEGWPINGRKPTGRPV